MSRIRILPEHVANRIAAGEVVERPASVVKELVENALDAGATSVRVEAEAGGRRLIRVVDDGCGMSQDDALLAFERHATSKLRTADDLLSIATLGFRGEALPSIGAVSRLVLETCEKQDKDLPQRTQRRAEGEEDLGAASSAPTSEGTRIEIAGGRMVSCKPAGLPPGTTITVSDLFYCVPARRKFLKSDTTELGHIASVVTHYALANPDRLFQLKTPSQEIVHATPVRELRERVYQLFGRTALEELVELEPVTAPMRAAITEPALEPGEEGSTLSVRGFISRPEVQRPNRNGTYIFVNRRLIRDRLILHAVNEAYRNVIPPGVFPVVLLFLDLPAGEVDVNVHPAKVEVRFRHPSFVHDFTRDAIRQTLSKARPVASFPAGKSGPHLATESVAKFSAPANQSELAPGAPPADFESGSLPRVPIPVSENVPLHEGFALTPEPLAPVAQRFAFETGFAVAPAVERRAAHASEQDLTQRAQRAAEGAEERTASPASATSIATLKPLGQVSSSFIVAVNGEGLWLIDQHVAHERILFEQHLRARRAGAIEGQRLLVPIVAELSPRQVVILEQIAEELRANGFEVETLGPRSVAIQAAPAGIAAGDAEKLLLQILEAVEGEARAVSMETLQAKIAASTACQAAIKVNMPLDQTKMEWLIGELAKTEHPMACPHGRPVVLRYSLREIEKAFKRI
jgi:DNA mismatch repair protein MutL